MIPPWPAQQHPANGRLGRDPAAIENKPVCPILGSRWRGDPSVGDAMNLAAIEECGTAAIDEVDASFDPAIAKPGAAIFQAQRILPAEETAVLEPRAISGGEHRQRLDPRA